MGNCTGYFFSKGMIREQKEFKMLTKERVNEAIKTIEKSKAANFSDYDTNLYYKYEDKITRIQKNFLGFLVRKKNRRISLKIPKTKTNQSADFLNDNDPRKKIHEDQRKSYPLVKIDANREYIGEWKNGMKDGQGQMIWQDKTTYIGEFSLDKVCGFGKLIHSDGDIYIGYWKDDRASGIGKYSTTKGASYAGFWEKDKQSGFGQETWPRGSFFNGEYKDGMKNGIGQFYFESGVIYEGEFYNNDINGIGTYRFTDNKTYTGSWKNNKMNGYGIINWPDGRCFEGFFVDDKREGFGIYYNGLKIYLGYWKNSKMEGKAIIIDGHTIKKVEFENNKISNKLPDNHPLPFEALVEEIIKEEYKS